MPGRHRRSGLGEYHKFDLSRGNIRTTMVADASLAGFVHYLNNAEMRGDGKKIVRILSLMLELQSIEAPVWHEQIDGPMIVVRGGRPVPNPALKKLAPAKYHLQLQIEEKQSSINDELAQYHFWPRVFCSGHPWWTVMWRVRAKAPKKRTLKVGIVQMDDGEALQLILDLARAGYLNRLRQCSCCRNWLYAKYRHQDYCSTKCQQEHYRNSDEWRTKRRIYMRNYRKQ